MLVGIIRYLLASINMCDCRHDFKQNLNDAYGIANSRRSKNVFISPDGTINTSVE